MAGFGERQDRGELKLTQEELSRLARDIDTVWCGEIVEPDEDAGNLRDLAGLCPEEAAQIFQTQLGATDAARLDERLGKRFGIACGVLSKNRGIPGGVCGTWRSDVLPILLISKDTPQTYDRPKEIAREVGILIYGENNTTQAREFAALVRDVFVEISADASAIEPSRVSLRQLASTAFRRQKT